MRRVTSVKDDGSKSNTINVNIGLRKDNQELFEGRGIETHEYHSHEANSDEICKETVRMPEVEVFEVAINSVRRA